LIATMLSGERSRVGITMLAITTLLVVGGLMVAGLIPAPVLGPDAGNASLASWLMAAFSFAVATVALVFSLGILLQGLEKSQERQYLLMGELRRERAALEQRVQNRTHALERRLGQIRAAAEITRATSRELDLQNLLLQVCELVQERFGLYYVGVFLIEGGEGAGQSGEARYATLAAGSGEAGRRMMAERHRLLVGGDSMIGWATANRQPRIALTPAKRPHASTTPTCRARAPSWRCPSWSARNACPGAKNRPSGKTESQSGASRGGKPHRIARSGPGGWKASRRNPAGCWVR